MELFSPSPCPLVAILRGLSPDEAPRIGAVLFEAGFRMLEVPLNRPGALDAIRALKKIAPDDALIGGGTILTVDDVDAVKEAGGNLVVSPNFEPDVVAYTVTLGMVSMPGVATPTEAFHALRAGAHGLKLFPAEMISPAVVTALRSVVPAETALFPVGGIRPDNMASYYAAGATGFGIGGKLYKPGMNEAAIQRAASEFMDARRKLFAPQ